MEDFTLGTVLFLFYFCFACCLLHSPAPANAVALQSSTELKVSIDQLEVEEVAAKEEPSFVPQAVPEEEQPALEPEQLVFSPTWEELLDGIDLESLQLRPARKIAGKLRIAQKVNGKDQPLAWLRAQIKKRLQEKPEEAIPVIKEVLSAA